MAIYTNSYFYININTFNNFCYYYLYICCQCKMSEINNIKNDINVAISFIENIPQNISKIVTGGISNIHL